MGISLLPALSIPLPLLLLPHLPLLLPQVLRGRPGLRLLPPPPPLPRRRDLLPHAHPRLFLRRIRRLQRQPSPRLRRHHVLPPHLHHIRLRRVRLTCSVYFLEYIGSPIPLVYKHVHNISLRVGILSLTIFI